MFGMEELTHRSSDTRSPLSTARESDLGHTTARAQMTSRLASYRSYVSQDSVQDENAALAPSDTRRLLVRSLLAVFPVSQADRGFVRDCAQARPLVARPLVARLRAANAESAIF